MIKSGPPLGLNMNNSSTTTALIYNIAVAELCSLLGLSFLTTAQRKKNGLLHQFCVLKIPSVSYIYAHYYCICSVVQALFFCVSEI
jgi:hypothetical protein